MSKLQSGKKLLGSIYLKKPTSKSNFKSKSKNKHKQAQKNKNARQSALRTVVTPIILKLPELSTKLINVVAFSMSVLRLLRRVERPEFVSSINIIEQTL
jgi:hypothetical protein